MGLITDPDDRDLTYNTQLPQHGFLEQISTFTFTGNRKFYLVSEINFISDFHRCCCHIDDIDFTIVTFQNNSISTFGSSYKGITEAE